MKGLKGDRDGLMDPTVTIEDRAPRVVLFDGVCNVCNAAVNFIIDRDPEGLYRFASLQSETGGALARQYGIGPEMDTMALIDGDRAYTQSTAALRVARTLSGPWPALYALVLVPRGVRDWLYRFFAARRYAWFGRRDVCRVPTPDLRRRFLDWGQSTDPERAGPA